MELKFVVERLCRPDATLLIAPLMELKFNDPPGVNRIIFLLIAPLMELKFNYNIA